MSKKRHNKNKEKKIEALFDGMNAAPIEPDQTTPQVDASVLSSSLPEEPADAPRTEEPEGQREDVPANIPDLPEAESLDDVLDDVRQSLIEDDLSREDEKKSKWWNRLVKGAPKSESADVVAPETKEEDATVSTALPETEKGGEGSGEYVEQIDELIKLLETEEQVQVPATPLPVPPPEPEVIVDVEELKKQAFSPRPKEDDTDVSEVRQVALGGDEEVFVEVESRAENPLDDRIKAVENALRPYRSYFYYVLAFIGVIMAVMASVLLYNAYQESLPEPVATEVVNLPYPTSLTLPGGLSFGLGRGALKDGEWNPGGPEWLEGTEICRWVAIPWSRQLEAAIRTMTQEDTIQLSMSNNDKLTYTVYSIREMTFAEIQELDSNTPCLILILAKQDSDKRWVVTGIP